MAGGGQTRVLCYGSIPPQGSWWLLCTEPPDNEGQHQPKHPGGSNSNCQGLGPLLLPQRPGEHRTQQKLTDLLTEQGKGDAQHPGVSHISSTEYIFSKCLLSAGHRATRFLCSTSVIFPTILCIGTILPAPGPRAMR